MDYNRRSTQIALLGVTSLLVASCTPAAFEFSSVSPAEKEAVSGNPFGSTLNMTGVDDSQDATIPNNGLIANDKPSLQYVQRCDQTRYAAEKAEAEQAVIASQKDPNPANRLVGVQYSISAGSKVDILAQYAGHRTILRKGDKSYVSGVPDGATPIFVGSVDLNNSTEWGSPSAFYYIVDHSQARADYIAGKRCYFTTVKVLSIGHGSVAPSDQICPALPSSYISSNSLDVNAFKNPHPCTANDYYYALSQGDYGSKLHGHNILYYGDDYSPGSGNDPKFAHRLFKKIEDFNYGPGKDSVQFAPLYVADFREKVFETSPQSVPLLSPNFVSSAQRRHEYGLSFKKIFNLDQLFTRRLKIEKQMKVTNLITGTDDNGKYLFEGYDGVQQLIDNIIHSGLDGTIVSTQYTPIVLDLGDKNIKTSSRAWGSFFNVGNLTLNDAAMQATLAGNPDPSRKWKVSHETAWLGGQIKDVSPDESKHDWQRIAEDGFLVIPNAKGEVLSSEQLFSAFLNVKGITYANGFEALVALTKGTAFEKNCDLANTDIKTRYFGPWDGDLYTKTVQVWIDKNRNGLAEPSEMSSLAQAGVLAINVCTNSYSGQNFAAQDAFGNQTSLRTATLIDDGGGIVNKKTGVADENEIIYRLKNGQKSASYGGGSVEFRVAIDLFFQTNTHFYLQDYTDDQINFPTASPNSFGGKVPTLLSKVP